MANNVFDLTELRKQIDEMGAVAPSPAAEQAESEALTFPPVALAADAELARSVPLVPLVADALRLTLWTGTRPVAGSGLLPDADAEAARAELELDDLRLHLAWVVAVNSGMLRILNGGAARGPLPDELPAEAALEFWDGVVMDVLDRADAGLTGSPVIDEHLAETLATLYSAAQGVAPATLVESILQAHELVCAPGPDELTELVGPLGADLPAALGLLEYAGLVDLADPGGVRLTALGAWAVRRDLIREGHDAPTTAEVEVFADLDAAELVAAIVSGQATPNVVAYWLEHHSPAEAARELIQVAATGTAGQRGAVGAILEELGPEAEVPVREALTEPLMWRYAASWLHVRDLQAPPLTPEDHSWIAVDSLAALLYFADATEAMSSFDVLEAGEDLVRLIGEMAAVEHPDAIAVFDLLADHHAEPAVAKAARKAAMKARSLQARKLG